MRSSAASTIVNWLPEPLAVRARPLVDRLAAVAAGEGENNQASRTSLTAFAIRIASAALALFSQVLMARWLGGFEYGIFVLVWTSMLILGNLSCLGFHTSVVRYIPEYREKGELDNLRGVMAGSRLFVLIVSTLFAAAGLAAVWALAGRIESYYVIPFLLGIVCLPMIALSDTLEGIARANSWAITALAPIYILRPIIILAALGLALLSGQEPDATTALVAAILATYATTLFQIVTITARTRGEVAGARSMFRWRQWLLVSLPIFLVEGFFFMLTNADVLMVGYFMDPTDVAVYFATVKTLALVHFVYFAVKAGVAQRYARYAHGTERDKLAAFARQTAGWTFWPSLAMGVAVLVIGKPMLMLFGPGFDAGYPLLFVLVLGVVARSSVGPAESLLTMSGHQNVCAALYGITLAINVALNIVLIPVLGLWGAAIATAVAMACEAAMLSYTVWRKLGIVMSVFMPAERARGVV